MNFTITGRTVQRARATSELNKVAEADIREAHGESVHRIALEPIAIDLYSEIVAGIEVYEAEVQAQLKADEDLG